MEATESLSASDALEQDIASLKEQVATLRKSLKIECSTILSSDAVQAKIQSSSTTSSRPPRKSRRQPQTKLQSRSAQQHAYIQQCIYRISTAVTAFKIHDPDPNAVDGGHVLGLRFEIMSSGQFLRPYYVMLNRPFPGSSFLRVHRHTIPPAIALAGTSARYLPSPKPQGGADDTAAPTQDLERFARALRRQIMRYHNRLGTMADLRRALGLHEKTRTNLSDKSVVELGVADIEAKQIRLAWADGRTGRLVMDDDGKVLKVMVYGPRGRDWDATKELFGTYDRIEDVAAALREHAET